MKKTADLGLVGLGVMGQNLVLNLADRGNRVAVYNRTRSVTDAFMTGEAGGASVIATSSLEELATALERPRRVMLMVKAGPAVDAVIDQLLPHLEPGDIIIDGGNSHFPDTERRVERLRGRGMHFVGMGISGGEEGARHGPSIMPGGDSAAWPAIESMFRGIAAVAFGEPCCQWVGDGGAGHYVKMIHNGIEYGDMQVIAEAYQLMREGLGMAAADIAEVFAGWNRGTLESYLIEITAEILRVEDRDGQPLVDKILDSAGQKGTGKWTAVNALELGIPLTLIDEAVNGRFLSSLVEERKRAAGLYRERERQIPASSEITRALGDAVYAAKIVSYAQGFMLMRQAAQEYGWSIDYGAVAGLWRGGCIIRSRFLNDITGAFGADPALDSLMVAPFFRSALEEADAGWRRTVSLAIELGIAAPAMSSALAFRDGYTSARVPANLIQAQRDYFGAHSYRRVDRSTETSFHFDWAGDRQEREID